MAPCFPCETTILDCGAGTGAWVERLHLAGYSHLWAIDRDADGYSGPAPFVQADLDADFAAVVRDALAPSNYDLITAIEVLEHLENPSHFLRQCRSLLAADGRLILTSPNPESAAARLKFLLNGELRHFDRHGDPTHITPIFPGLLERIARTNAFRIDAVWPVPNDWGFAGTRRWKRWLSRAFGCFTRGHVWGDCNLFLLSPVE